MKLTIDELRPLAVSKAPHDLRTLAQVETLDLSNGGIVGDQIVALLSPSISVTIGWATLAPSHWHTCSRQTPHLVALDLFENGIRDDGALALVHAVQAAVSDGHLPRFTSLGLHDNDISETVLRAVDAAWQDMPATRALGWMRLTLPTESSTTMGFGDLLKRQAEIVVDAHMAALSEPLLPLTTFLKRVLWHRVTRNRKVGGSLVLRMFPAPTVVPDAVAPLLGSDLVYRPDYTCNITVAESLDLRTYPRLTELMALVEPERAKSLVKMRRNALAHGDPDGELLAFEMRSDVAMEDAVLGQIDAACASAMAVEKDPRVLSVAVSRSLGLQVTVSAVARTWVAEAPGPRSEKLTTSRDDRSYVKVRQDVEPCVQVPGDAKRSAATPVQTDHGYEIVCEIPG